jgi:F420-non-reducing hydrogenase iron-sulfur subunit
MSEAEIIDQRLTTNDQRSSFVVHPSSDNGFQPEIVAFCCHYCAYAAADLAGAIRLQYPDSIKIVKLPCTGKLDVLHVLRAFEDGADGVFVAGCLEGDCHYLKGNLNAKRRVKYAKTLLDQLGLDGQRVEMFNMSSAMGKAFADAATEMTERVRALGPSPLQKRSGDR